MMRHLVFGLLTSAALTGQSLASGSNVSVNGVPLRPNGSTTRLEFYVHNIQATKSGNIIQASPFGFRAYFQANDFLQVETRSEQLCNFDMRNFSNPSAVLVRVTQQPDRPAIFCELWNATTGDVLERAALVYDGLGAGGGDVLSSNPTGFAVGFVRIHSTVAPVHNRPPQADDDADRLMEWKFNGNLTPSAGAWTPTGTATFVASPSAIAVVPQTGTPTRLLPQNPCTAGQPCTLSSASASLLDGASISCTWLQLTGPPARPANPAACTTTVTPPVRVPLSDPSGYIYRLTVTDGTNTASREFELGVVATFANGLVAFPDSRLYNMMMPVRPAGTSPYERLEQGIQKLEAGSHRNFATAAGWLADGPAYTRHAAGTFSYRLGGYFAGGNRASLRASISASDMTIPIANAERLALSQFPTLVLLSPDSASEWVLVCATTATSGNADLTVCPTGRGVGGTTFGSTASAGPSSFASGVGLMSHELGGFGADLVSGVNAPCPAGAPGPIGPVEWTGTVSVSGTTVTGSGTSWAALTAGSFANFNPWKVRIQFTVGGTPRVWWAYLSSITNNTTLVLDRAVPAGVDSTSGLTAHIVGEAQMAAGFTQVDTTIIQAGFAYTGLWPIACTSATRIHAVARYDMSGMGLDNSTQVAQPISTFRGINPFGEFGATWYSPDLGALNQALRSGRQAGVWTARQMCGQALTHPENANGGGIILFQAPVVLSAITCATLFPDVPVKWRHIRKTLERPAPTTCYDYDGRELGYLIRMWGLAAQFDPEPTMRDRWATRLNTTRTLLAASCRRADNSYSNAFYWNANRPEMTLTNGSVGATGGSAANCHGKAAGTASASAGSAILIGSGFVDGTGGIMVSSVATGKMLWLSFTRQSSTQVTLSAQWPGGPDYPSGSVRWMITDRLPNPDNATYTSTVAFGQTHASASLASVHVCMYDAGTNTSTLDRPWIHATGAYRPYTSNVVGLAQQPFFVGGMLLQGFAAANVIDPLWAEEITRATGWMMTDAWNAAGGIFHYAVNEAARPLNLAPNGTFDYISPEHTFNPNSTVAIGVWRDINYEGWAGLGQAYRLSKDAAVLARIIEIGRASWCSPFDASQAGCDYKNGPSRPGLGGPNDQRMGRCFQANASCAELGSGKYRGFLYGNGYGQGLDAIALDVPAPASGTATVAYHPSATWRASGGVSRIAPSGEVVTQACPTSPCAITFDARLGSAGMIR